MCQPYEHSRAESTIDLDSSHHRCRETGENLLILRCDNRLHALATLEYGEAPRPRPGCRQLREQRAERSSPSTTPPSRFFAPTPRTVISLEIPAFSRPLSSAPGRTRTGNLRIRRPMLYPLSYGGVRKRPTSLRHHLRDPHPHRRLPRRHPSTPGGSHGGMTPPSREQIKTGRRMVPQCRRERLPSRLAPPSKLDRDGTATTL